MRLRHAAKAYARKLPRFLAENWGGSKTYTPEQLQVAVERLGLSPDFIAVAYAVYLPRETFDALIDRVRAPVTYEAARRAFGRFLPLTSASSPAPVSAYVIDGR